ncbi:hypothetical protein [Sphingorhabdus sp. 109]|uniref:hypothetical protein n=1 Tax=Sphingorhabdus sp. 109 TaxID=2653173 RepID=UPI00135BC971|nr:hypothetical protein [Sphingorhabdus sp. 109]
MKGPDRWTNPGAFLGGGCGSRDCNFFASDLNRREQHDAADGEGGDNIEKRFHGFSPYYKRLSNISFPA